MLHHHLTSPLLHRAALLAAALSATLVAYPAVVEPPIIPTVHPLLTPTSAINLPLQVRADHVSVWRKDSEQRMLTTGHVVIQLGYRTLHANNAAIFLAPSREGGESTLDVVIFLDQNAQIQEGNVTGSTTTSAPELIVTTRISNSVQLSGVTPQPQSEEASPIVQRGDQLRIDLANRPPAQIHIPTLVITDTEAALQSGWIARGPGNRIITAPGELAVITPAGVSSTQPAGPTIAPPPKPRPQIFATGDIIELKKVDNEQVTLVRGNFYLMRTTPDNKPPLELRAQKAVLFSPSDRQAAATQPTGQFGQLSRTVTGAYLEGDVTINYGSQTVKASRIYYDFTSDRAIMLDATLNTVDEVRNVPLYMHAAEIRQLARGEYAAKSVKFSTSEFYTPHYHIGASDIYLQDITPRDEHGNPVGPASYAFKAKNDTLNVQGVPIFYWPYLSGDTEKNILPLRKIRVGNSKDYGVSIETDWDIFGLAGLREPKGVHAQLELDYFSKRGPAGGVDADWKTPDNLGLLRSYIMQDHGVDRFSATQDNIDVLQDVRGRAEARDRMALDDNWTLALEGAYISDPNFVPQFFPAEYLYDKEPETSVYLKYQNQTEALSFLGKWTLFDFTATADQVYDQFTTDKSPEVKYWRIGDSLLDCFTYYSENGLANVRTQFTNFTPTQLGLVGIVPAVPPNQTFESFYHQNGWTSNAVLRGDSRQEIDMPLQIGDAKITPYATGRVTAWNTEFPDTNTGDSTTRLWGASGIRGAMEFWRVYNNVDSQFWDLHRIRHIIEPQFNLFVAGSTAQSADLQPFDRDVEQISDASGFQLNLHQKWQTKRGGEGHWRNVDWIVLNVSGTAFWHKPEAGPFFPGDPARGFVFDSRPDLSLVADSINTDFTWRLGERVRYLAEASYNVDNNRLEQLAQGIAIDHSPSLSYFVGNRYIEQLTTDEWTVGADYQLTRKYTISASESYDFQLHNNIITSGTISRKLPRFTMAVTVTYDANAADTTVVVTAWPEGFPDMGFGSSQLRQGTGQ